MVAYLCFPIYFHIVYCVISINVNVLNLFIKFSDESSEFLFAEQLVSKVAEKVIHHIYDS